MKISLNWIKKYVDLAADLDPKDLANKLTISTVEVEGFNNLAQGLDKIVVGKVLKIMPHPNADKLKLVEVDVKNKVIKVVCGGNNLKEGMLVALAQVGAKVKWHGEGDLVTLERAKIRGEESEGMICAAEEIGLTDLLPAKQAGEIIDLSDKNFPIGQSLAEALGLDDVVYEIDNKSLTNRPDLWGHYGLAREVAAQLLDNARMAAGLLEDPHRMLHRMNALLERVVERPGSSSGS